MTCRRSPCTFSSRVIGRSSQSGPLQGVVTLGTIGQMALTLSGHKCQHYSDSVQPSGPRSGRAAPFELTLTWRGAFFGEQVGRGTPSSVSAIDWAVAANGSACTAL